MSIDVPTKNIAEFVGELINECTVSREQRRSTIKTWQGYYYNGCLDNYGLGAPYNRCFSHVDRLASFLFSPVDVRFDIEFDLTEEEDVHAMGRASARYLNREFHRCGVDLEFFAGVNSALVKGCAILRQNWGFDGLEPWLIQPEFFGVLREDIADLDRQEAFVQTSYLTRGQFWRTISDHPEATSIMKEVDASFASDRKEDDYDEDYIHQVIIGNLASAGSPIVSSSASGAKGMVGVSSVPTPILDQRVIRDLVRIDELWVQNRALQDYTTFRLVRPDILVEGRERFRNLSGVPGEHPFTKVCPNEVDGYFWGLSELAGIYKLQDLLNDQMADVRRISRLKADPPRAAIGFSGLTQEKYRTLKRPGGFISEETPNAKIETLAPDMPPELFEQIKNTIAYFDDVAGFTPIMMGQGEQGVRAGVHAQTLAKNSSPRMRDRALLVERQCVEAGDFSFKLLQSKDARVYDTERKSQFLLAQLAEDYRVTVDSHTSSPAFAEDAERKADKLMRLGAIDHAEYIRLTHPPHEDTLVAAAKARAEAQAKLMQQHPELLKGGRKPKAA